MKLHLLSDLHIEFGEWDYPKTDCDVVILAGDIHTKERGVKWALEQIKDKPVIYVLGNHEYYKKAYPKLALQLKEMCKGTNVHLLEQDVVQIDGINFFGCTLWTDFELLGDPRQAGAHCQLVMNDYHNIKKTPSYSKLRSLDTSRIHKECIHWLGQELDKRKGEKNIVVTHHAPSALSIPANRRDSLTSAAYASNLEDFILRHEPNAWVHGHLHNSSDYNIGSCRVLCNPKGYAGEENDSFSDRFTFEV